MKALKDKIHVLWLVAFVAVIAFYRIGFQRPVPGFDEEATKSIEGHYQQEAPTPPKEDPPAAPPESTSQSPQITDLKPEQAKDRQCRSENPLYFRIVFGEEGDYSTLGVLDESGGTGTGYNIAYIDENMNGDLTDETVKEFPRYERGSRAGELDPRVEFTGSFKGEENAKYTLNIYSLTRKTQRRAPGNDYYFHWFLDIHQWNYFFINGKMTLFSNTTDALRGKPVRLGGQCQWEISARTRGGKPTISAGLKDGNGCTLRSVRRANQRQSPILTLLQNGQVKAEEKMKFG